jgi:Uma2 family endonuclease
MAIADDGWLSSLRPQPARMTAEEYEALPEEICRAIEIVDGYVVYSEAPTPAHQTAGRRLANLIERDARAAMTRGHGCLTVNSDVDLRLRDVPLVNRRPDVVLYQCLEPRERLSAAHVLLVVEIVSPGSETTDSVDKLGEYAKAGIPHYWIARLDDTGLSVIERYQLDRAAGQYKHLGTFMRDEPGGVPSISNPIPISIDWQDLEF